MQTRKIVTTEIGLEYIAVPMHILCMNLTAQQICVCSVVVNVVQAVFKRNIRYSCLVFFLNIYNQVNKMPFKNVKRAPTSHYNDVLY